MYKLFVTHFILVLALTMASLAHSNDVTEPMFLKVFHSGSATIDCSDTLEGPSDPTNLRRLLKQFQSSTPTKAEVITYLSRVRQRSLSSMASPTISYDSFLAAVIKMVRFRLHFKRYSDDLLLEMPDGNERNFYDLRQKIGLEASDLSRTWIRDQNGNINLQSVARLISSGRADHGVDPLTNVFAIRVIEDCDGSYFLTVEPFNRDDSNFLTSRPEAYLYLTELLLNEGLPVRLSDQVINAAEQ